MIANITEKTEEIRSAIYGKEVRESLASGLEAMNEECQQVKAVVADVSEAADNANAQAAAAKAAAEQADTAAAEAKELIDNFVDDRLIANETTPGSVKSGGGITVAADGSVSLNDVYCKSEIYAKNEIDDLLAAYADIGKTCAIRSITIQTIGASDTNATFDTPANTDDIYTAAGTIGIKIKKSGTYTITANVLFNSNNPMWVWAAPWVNGRVINAVATQYAVETNAPTLNVTGTLKLAANDVVTVWVKSTHGNCVLGERSLTVAKIR